MTISLFTLIAWAVICVFALIPKSLSKVENIVLFFLLSITVINIFTILDLNLRFVGHSNKSDMFISMLILRNIILPLLLVFFLNLLFRGQSGPKAAATVIAELLALNLSELLAVWTGVITYLKWNAFYTFVTFSALMYFSVFLTKQVRRL